jgi:hypothetical protein
MKPLRWKPLLCVCASSPKYVASAIKYGPDTVILDHQRDDRVLTHTGQSASFSAATKSVSLG